MNELKSPLRAARVTIRTVASDAGVSVAAVSKVLRNAYGVSDGLRQKVTASIEKLDYRPSVAARGMRGQTYTVGILLVELANPFLPDVVAGVNAVLAPSSYKAMLGIGQSNSPLEESLIKSMIDYRMDGLILVAPMIPGEVLSRYAKQIPIVTIGHHQPTSMDFDTVNADDQKGAAIAVKALAAKGYRDIMMVTPDTTNHSKGSVIRQREIGYRRTMADLGLTGFIRITQLPNTRMQNERANRSDAAITAILAAPDRPRAVFCWSDLDALTIINSAHLMGLRVPQDIAVVGYDNSPPGAMPLIGLTSVDQSAQRLGELAAQTLLSRIAGRQVANHVMLDPTLVVRTSL